MRIYDITLPVSNDLPVWPGDPSIHIERIAKMEEGSFANITRIDMGAHVGTHVDAPYHFLGGDAPAIEKLDLRVLTGRTHVVHLTDDVDLITAEVLQRAGLPVRARRILFRTRNSRIWTNPHPAFEPDFVGLSADGATYLVERGARLVGVDYLGVAPFAEPIPTHCILLAAGIVILEGLDLSQVSQGVYTLYCLPLKLVGSDGAPARAILVGNQ